MIWIVTAEQLSKSISHICCFVFYHSKYSIRTKTNNKMFHLTLETYYNLGGDCVLFYFFTIFFFVWKLLTRFWTMRNLTKYTGQKKCWKSFVFGRIKLRVSCRKNQIEQIFSVNFICIHKWNFQLFRYCQLFWYFQRNDKWWVINDFLLRGKCVKILWMIHPHYCRVRIKAFR